MFQSRGQYSTRRTPEILFEMDSSIESHPLTRVLGADPFAVTVSGSHSTKKNGVANGTGLALYTHVILGSRTAEVQSEQMDIPSDRRYCRTGSHGHDLGASTG